MWHSAPGAALLLIGLSWLAIAVGAVWLWWKDWRDKQK